MSLEVDGEAKRVAKYHVWQLNKCLRRRRAGLIFWVLGAALLAPAPIRGQINGILNKLRQLSQSPRQPIHKSNSLLPQQSAQQTAHNVLGGPHITSVSPIYPLRMQKIAIRGTGFGTADPYNGWSGYLMFVDISHGNGITTYWQAGCPVYVCGTGGVSVYVTKWTPTEIDVEGFPQNYGTGTFGMCNCTFHAGHQVQILVANPQMLGAIKQPAPAPYSFPAAAHGTPYDAYTATVAPWQNPVSITSVSTLQARRLQKIVIRGTGFGNHEPFNGTTPFLGFKDITANNWEAGFDGTVGIIVSSWTPDEITIDGFSQGYGGDRVLHNGDMVSISVGDPQMTGVVSNPGTEFNGAPHATKFVTVGEPSSSTTSGSPTVQVRAPVVNGMSVSVNGVATPSAPGATITQISWNWGDGTPSQIGEFPETHTFTQAGTYAISITATDSHGATGSAQTNVKLATPVPSSTTLWTSQVVPSANDRTAGQVTLNWNIPNGSACKLSVSPAIQNLSGAIPIECSGSQLGWTASIPNNSSRNPVQYTFQLTGMVGSASVSSSPLSVFALPSLTYGGGTSSSISFNSLTNSKAYGTKPVLCSLQLGCGIDFGLSDSSAQSGSPSMTCVPGTAKCDGLTVAGVVGWGILGAVAGDYDSLQAEYAPLNSSYSGYTEYLEVRPQVGIVSIEACAAGEGGAGTQPYIQLTDNLGGNYYWSPKSPEDCANLLAGPLGNAIETAFFFSQDVTKLQQDLQPLIQGQIMNAEKEVQVGSAGAQILLDLGNLTAGKSILPVSVTALEQALSPLTPCTNASVTPCVPIWQRIIHGGSPYSISVSAGAALVSLGANGAGDLVIGHSEIGISGLAVPTNALREVPQPVSSGLISIDVSPSIVAEGAQFTVSGTVKNTTGALQTGAKVQLSALVSGSTLPLTTVTTGQNGSFSALLNAPPVTGSVVITATVQDTSPPVQGTATLTVTGSP